MTYLVTTCRRGSGGTVFAIPHSRALRRNPFFHLATIAAAVYAQNCVGWPNSSDYSVQGLARVSASTFMTGSGCPGNSNRVEIWIAGSTAPYGCGGDTTWNTTLGSCVGQNAHPITASGSKAIAATVLGRSVQSLGCHSWWLGEHPTEPPYALRRRAPPRRRMRDAGAGCTITGTGLNACTPPGARSSLV